MKKLTSLAMFGTLFGLSSMAYSTCYPAEMAQHKPKIMETVVFLADTSSDPTAVKASINDVISKVTNAVNRRFVVLSYSGNTTNESLTKTYDAVLEKELTNEDALNDIAQGVTKNHAKCIKKQHADVRREFLQAAQSIIAKSPIVTKRSEIAYAVADTIKNFNQPGGTLLLLNLSDGLEFSQSGRSFYGANQQPRKLDVKYELRSIGKEVATAPRKKAEASYVKVLWWGMLAMPTSEGKDKNKQYLDTATITSFTSFWDLYLKSHGADTVFIGAPQLLNPDISIPIDHPK
jgi:hypothetical protein